MGLDMRAIARKNKDIGDWRKHNRLHGWMCDLWLSKNPREKPRNFNCKELVLTKEDIDQLEQDIENNELPETEGFFFGTDSYEWGDFTKKQKEDDLKFIEKARMMMKMGYIIIYDSWW